MQLVLERNSIDKPLTFHVNCMQLSFHTSVFTSCTIFKIFSIQMLQYFSQIVQTVCTLVIFIITLFYLYINIIIKNEKHLKINKEVGMLLQKRANTSGVYRDM